MQVHETIDSFREALDAQRAAGRDIGFVPTMGALHDGHVSLVTRSATDCDVSTMSIFVNPLQFAAGEDLGRYPRPFEADCARAEAAGVMHLFAPSVEEMYPDGELATTVRVAGVTDTLEGELRPGHFYGVATVVAKLFAITGPCNAYFGEKDWQQLEVVRRLAGDLSLPVEVIGCPIVREVDGLALSSRNVYLDPRQRRAALRLHEALQAGSDTCRGGQSESHAVHEAMLAVLRSDPLVQPQYAAHVGPAMRTKPTVEPGDRLLVAALLGNTHLIDNMGIG